MTKTTGTFWKTAWLSCLPTSEDEAEQLKKGKTYTRRMHSDQLECSPGLLQAHHKHKDTQHVQVGIQCFTDKQKNALKEKILEEPAIAAAIISGKIPEELAEIILPSKTHISYDCSCGSPQTFCRHLADSCWAAAETIRNNPFMLLLLRGQDREELLSFIRQARSQKNGELHELDIHSPRGIRKGISAAAAYKKQIKPKESNKSLPKQPGSPIKLAVAPPQDFGISETELSFLIQDAAQRAYDLVLGTQPSFLNISEQHDYIRRATNRTLCSPNTKLSDTELRNYMQAWEFGKEAGLLVTQNSWNPPEELLKPGVTALTTFLNQKPRTRKNIVSLQNIQLRLDQQGFWWRFTPDEELGWVLCTASSQDPEELIPLDS